MTPLAPILLPDRFNAAEYFVDRHIAEGRGNKVAIECGDQCVTYRQLFELVNQVGNGLRKLGVRGKSAYFCCYWILLSLPLLSSERSKLERCRSR